MPYFSLDFFLWFIKTLKLVKVNYVKSNFCLYWKFSWEKFNEQFKIYFKCTQFLICLKIKDGVMTNKMFPKHKYSNNGIIPVAKTSNNLLYNKVLKKNKIVFMSKMDVFHFSNICAVSLKTVVLNFPNLTL